MQTENVGRVGGGESRNRNVAQIRQPSKLGFHEILGIDALKQGIQSHRTAPLEPQENPPLGLAELSLPVFPGPLDYCIAAGIRPRRSSVHLALQIIEDFGVLVGQKTQGYQPPRAQIDPP